MADLPSGTVTFLFTDIEGSTALWERDRQAMAQAVERHLALLGEAVTAHGGVLFKTVGDAVQAAFPTAPGAIGAALSAQGTLQAELWSNSPAHSTGWHASWQPATGGKSCSRRWSNGSLKGHFRRT
jgi:class 3 adenylate cyclase